MVTLPFTLLVILFVAEAVHAGIECHPLIEAPPYVLVPRGHRLQTAESVTRADLRGEPLVLLDLPMTNLYYRDLAIEAGAPRENC